MNLKTIALDSMAAVAERKEFNLGYNDGLCGESVARDAGEEYWEGYDKGRWDGGLFGWRAGWDEAFRQYGSCRNPKWAMTEPG